MNQFATGIGLAAIGIWSLGALLYAYMTNIPAGQIVTLSMLAGFIIGLAKIAIQGNWHELNQPFKIWICGLLGSTYYNSSYAMATKYAPIEKVTLIVTMSPIFIVVFSSIFLKLSFSLRYLAAICIGIAALVVLTASNTQLNFNIEETKGYLLALSCSIGFAIFTLTLKRFRAPLDMFVLYSGLGALLAGIYHLQFEQFVIPTIHQWFCMISLGTLMNLFAYYFWSYGIMHGHLKSLNIALFFIPILSVSWLVVFEKAKFSEPLVIAIILVTISSILATPIKKHNHVQSK